MANKFKLEDVQYWFCDPDGCVYYISKLMEETMSDCVIEFSSGSGFVRHFNNKEGGMFIRRGNGAYRKIRRIEEFEAMVLLCGQ